MLEIANIISQWGIAGLLFVMWWYERKDKMGAIKHKNELHRAVIDQSKLNGTLVDLVRSNTEAIVTHTAASTAIRDEIRQLREYLNAQRVG